jgi:uncharacterized delta-60 repeat protein
VVARYLDDGRLDRSFAGDGLADFGTGVSTDEGATAVLVAPDGKIVVAGASAEAGRLVLAALLPDGRPDLGFGVGALSILGSDEAAGFRPRRVSALGRQANGRILVAGNGFVAGFTPRGVVDPTFHPSGPRPGVLSTTEVHDLLVEPDDRVLVAGGQLGDRLHADGAGATPVLPCSSLGPMFCQSYAVARQPDDGATVFAFSPFDDTTRIGRVDAQGRLDRSFGSDGYVAPASTYVGVAIGVQRDHAVVALADSALYRFRPDGTVDQGYGDHGRQVVADHSRGVLVDAFAIDRQDRAVAVGSRGTDLLVARFTTR